MKEVSKQDHELGSPRAYITVEKRRHNEEMEPLFVFLKVERDGRDWNENGSYF